MAPFNLAAIRKKNADKALSMKTGGAASGNTVVLPSGSGAQGLGTALAAAGVTGSQQGASSAMPPPVGLQQKQATVATPPASSTPANVFGGAAMQQNTTSPNYLETRNTGLATDYSKLGLKDVNAVYQELSKNADFASAADQDKKTTADAIWAKMGQTAGATGTTDPNATTTGQAGVKTDDIPKDTKEYATLTDAEQDNPWISTLSEVEKQAYSMMSETEKKQFINIGRNDLKNTATYVARWKEQRDFNQQQGNIATQQAKLQNENASIMDNQRIRQAKQQLGNLEKNIGYLGTMGSPGVSATKMTAIKDQYTEAEKVFTELQTMAKNQEELRKLGMEDLASRLDFQMKGLQDDLDDKVSKAMQESLAGLSAADIKNQLDTVEEIDAFRKNLITNLDSKIGGFMDDNIKARAFLIERFDVLAKDMKDQANKQMEADALFTKNANTVNVDMSTAQGFFVDGNGQPIISATTGQVIPMPQKPPMEPILKDGQLITFTSGENGELIPHVQQVSKPAGKIETIYTTDERGNEVKQSVIMHEDGTYTPVSFGGGQSTTPTADVSGAITGSSVAPTLAANPASIVALADSMEPGKEYDCGTRGQCGEWFNDAIGKSNGTKVADTYASKTKYVDPSITVGQPGMGVVFNPGAEYKENGHIGMLASGLETNNGQKGYRVVSANYGGDEKLSKDFIPEGLIAATRGGFIPTKPTATQQESPAGAEPATKANRKENMMKAMSLVGGFGSKDERAAAAQNIVQTAEANGLTLIEAKKKLGYKTPDDVEFAKSRKESFETVKDITQTKMTQARTTLKLLQSTKPTAIGDVAAVVGFLKTIDPSSVARESEVASVENARGVVQNIEAQIAKAGSGKKLSNDQRTQLKNAMSIIINAADNNYYTTIGDMKQEFDDRGLDITVYVPKNDVAKAKTTTQSQDTAPANTMGANGTAR